MDSCEAMDMIDKLNEEHDHTFSENIKLKEEIIELHKKIHKLIFLNMIEDDNSYIGYPGDYYGEGLFDWSDELEDAVEYGLEKNVILKEIYNWEEFSCDDWFCDDDNFPCVPAHHASIRHNPQNRKLVDTFQGGIIN
tara:strand:- start:59 stop:469 length:411 start_codon:yes stop_codon:yes gene_type:complete